VLFWIMELLHSGSRWRSRFTSTSGKRSSTKWASASAHGCALKHAVLDHLPVTTLIEAPHQVGERVTPVTLPLRSLRDVVQTVPGQKIGYIVDVSGHQENAVRIETLVAGADVLFIECAFLDADAEHAVQKNHLTAWQAGLLARRAQVGRLVPCHFSTRYTDLGDALSAEADRAFRGLSREA
jgi:ribonuclease Z